MNHIILTLLSLPSIGNKSINNIINKLMSLPKDEKELLEIIIDYKKNNKRIHTPSLEEIKIVYERSNNVIYKSKEMGIRIVNILDKMYPKNLIYIHNYPVILFYKGNYNALTNDKSVAVIGSRNASIEGLEKSYKIGFEFGKDNYSVISGLAKGCDTYAHKGCLDAKGCTVAVLPCGIDNIYPIDNAKLADNILENKGCIISEYPINTKISRYNFIQRDRIQSGLSNCVILCEASLKSGSMHTINFAKKQNKIIGCLDISTSGNQAIIKENKYIKINKIKDIENIKLKILKQIDNKQGDNFYNEYIEQIKMDL